MDFTKCNHPMDTWKQINLTISLSAVSQQGTKPIILVTRVNHLAFINNNNILEKKAKTWINMSQLILTDILKF